MSSKQAYSLIEILVVIVILVIVMLIAIPNLQRLLAANRMSIEVNRLVAAINFARYAAISYGQPVTLCPSHDGHRCSQNWSEPKLIFIDLEKNQRLESGDKLLRVIPALAGHAKLSWRGFHSQRALRFTPMGWGASLSGRFIYQQQGFEGNLGRIIVLNRLGRVRIEALSGQHR